MEQLATQISVSYGDKSLPWICNYDYVSVAVGFLFQDRHSDALLLLCKFGLPLVLEKIPTSESLPAFSDIYKKVDWKIHYSHQICEVIFSQLLNKIKQ